MFGKVILFGLFEIKKNKKKSERVRTASPGLGSDWIRRRGPSHPSFV